MKGPVPEWRGGCGGRGAAAIDGREYKSSKQRATQKVGLIRSSGSARPGPQGPVRHGPAGSSAPTGARSRVEPLKRDRARTGT